MLQEVNMHDQVYDMLTFQIKKKSLFLPMK